MVGDGKGQGQGEDWGGEIDKEKKMTEKTRRGWSKEKGINRTVKEEIW